MRARARARTQALAGYYVSMGIIEVLPNASARAAWEAQLSLEYGRPVAMRGAYDNTRPPDSAAPYWGITYTAGSNGSLVRALASVASA
jgi:hypothetical protein